VYAVGDSVPGGAKLHSVYSDRVLIDRDGRLESLTLPRQPNAGTAPPPSAAVLQSGAENSPIERMRRVITEQPGLLAEVLRPQPAPGQVAGAPATQAPLPPAAETPGGGEIN